MNVLVLGSGGREHSLCYNLIKSKKISNLWCMPGNAGINKIAKFSNLNTDDNQSILNFCIKKKINLVIPGSEEFLAKGVGDYLRLNGIKVFGPSKKSALLESSKIFTKQICEIGNIKTAKWEVFKNSKIALKKIRKLKFPIVIKLDKLAAGKGVLVAKDLEDAKRFLKKVEQGKIGDSNSKIIVEKKLTGKEASFFYVVDGNSSKFIGSAQDYKRVGENNTGLNTGGMGCISPSPYENEKNITFSFGSDEPPNNSSFGIEFSKGLNYVIKGKERILCENEIKLLGRHNLENICVDQLTKIGQTYLSAISELAPKASCIVDKMPTNFMFLGPIALAMPAAIIVHCRRDPIDTCLSCYKRLFSHNHPYSYDLRELGQFYGLYQRIMSHWTSVFPDRIVEVVYEDLVESFDCESRRLIEACGLDWEDNCMDFYKTERQVRTASIQQVRQPMNNKSIGAWKKYESFLTELKENIK